jgi:hypothetical protein
VQRCIANVTGFVYIDPRINKNFGGGKITPQNNTVEPIITIETACIYSEKSTFSEVSGCAQSREYLLERIIDAMSVSRHHRLAIGGHMNRRSS